MTDLASSPRDRSVAKDGMTPQVRLEEGEWSASFRSSSHGATPFAFKPRSLAREKRSKKLFQLKRALDENDRVLWSLRCFA